MKIDLSLLKILEAKPTKGGMNLDHDSFLSEKEKKMLAKKLCSDRNSLIVKVALATGGRLNEICGIKVSDVLKKPNGKGDVNYSIRLIGLKSSKDRELPITKGLYQDIMKMVKDNRTKGTSTYRIMLNVNGYHVYFANRRKRNGGHWTTKAGRACRFTSQKEAMAFITANELDGRPAEFIFNIGARQMQNLWDDFGIGKTFHKLRHTFAVEFLEADKQKDIMILKEALGHRSIMNTLEYAKVLELDKKLRKVLL